MRLYLKNHGILSGKQEREVEIGDANPPWDSPIIKAFVDDDDLQEMTIVSTSIGFVKTLTKYDDVLKCKRCGLALYDEAAERGYCTNCETFVFSPG